LHEDFEPKVAVVVAVYNEEDLITKKIENTFELDYPKEKLEIIFITDGSTDKSAAIVQEYRSIKHLHEAERRGKVAAMNRAVAFVQSPFIVFCDANTLLNKDCLRQIVKHYTDPRVGGVAGEKKIHLKGKDKASAAGEGLYWKYESLLKKLDSQLYTTVGAAGELFSIRTILFEKAPEDTIIEDFVQSLQLCIKGYVVRYEPMAYAMEGPSVSIKEEMKRKVRICAGAFQAIFLLKELFNVFRYPIVSFQFISHRILRWTVCPLALVFLFFSNFLIVFHEKSMLYRVMLALQLIFYFSGFIGWAFANRNIKVKGLYIPFYFLFMNVSVFLGFRRFINKKQSVLWEKAIREKVA
jgi:cellulose synthase/poly-beta-1,6-N-acetylglucosamine synthase-like glycosyltransferase